MADLRIVDAPVLLQESITDDVKMPTGGLGNYAIRLGDLVWYVVAKENLASKSYVDNSSKGVQDNLDNHIANKNNPHGVTKAQLGLGNVDNTSDINKPLSSAAINALSEKSDKADTYTKSETNSKISALSNTTYAGHKGYATLAEAQASQASLTANTLVEVTSDTTTANNGVYLWNGTTLTKSMYDPKAVAVAEAFAEAKTYTSIFYEQKPTIPFTKGYVYDFDGVRVQTTDPWYSTDKFLLKKGESINLSVFTPAGLKSGEKGSLLVFDKDGNLVATDFGEYGSNDRQRRVVTTYTATQDCLVALQSIHNANEGYDGLDDYCVINSTSAIRDYVNQTFELKTIVPFVKGYDYTQSGVRVQTSDPWYSTDKFLLKKGQTINLSVFTPAGYTVGEKGSLLIFDTNGNYLSTDFGEYGSNDRQKRVRAVYTAKQDCLVALKSIHNVSEGYDGLDDYCAIDANANAIKNYIDSPYQRNYASQNEVGYLISYFGEDNVGQDLILAYSRDGINFKQINRFVPPTTNTIRDPSIILHKNGWWYVCHTNTPYGNGFVSEKFNIIKSRDLITWHQVARIGFDNVQNWAPEFFVDDDGSVHIIGSINLDGTFQPYIFSALDDDLSTWSAGQKIQGAFNSASTSTSSTWIDGCMFKVGAEYYFIIKDETDGHKWLSIFKSTSLKSGFNTIVKDGSQAWSAISQKVEAPCIVKIDNGYRIYADGLPTYQGGLGQFLMYQDFDANFNPITNNVTKITSDTPMRHGTVIKVTGMQQYFMQFKTTAKYIADTATANDTESILAELRALKSALISGLLMQPN